MIAALTDTITDHPELLQPRDAIAANPANRQTFYPFTLE